MVERKPRIAPRKSAQRAAKLAAYRKKGWTWGEIADKFGMHRANVRRTVNAYLEKTNGAQTEA